MIEVMNRQKKYRVAAARFKRLLERLAVRYGKKNARITLVLGGRDAVRTLNRKYRRKDSFTDVLSFPLGEKAADGAFYLGDIIVSVPTAAAQARQAGHSLEKEIDILVIHSFLHLLGYDHSKAMDAEAEKASRLLEK